VQAFNDQDWPSSSSKRRSRVTISALAAIGAASVVVLPACNATTAHLAAGAQSTSDQTIATSAADVVLTRTGTHPKAAVLFHTTRAEAAKAVDANAVGMPASDPVTVVVFTGDFVDHQAKRPRGSTVSISGKAISVVYDSSGVNTDYGIGDVPDTSALGKPTTVNVG
jgi:hypothetical protein